MMLILRERHTPAATIHGLQAHQQNMRAANDEPLPAPRPFYVPEISLGEALFMVLAGTGVVAAMHLVVVGILALQAFLGGAA